MRLGNSNSVSVYLFYNCYMSASAAAPTRNGTNFGFFTVFVIAVSFIDAPPFACITFIDKRSFFIYFIKGYSVDCLMEEHR